VRPEGAGAAALRWWLVSLATAGATVTVAAALLAVALHVSGLAAPSAASSGGSAASSGAPYRLSQPREIEELRWEQEFAPPQLASPRKVIDSLAALLLVAAAVAFFVLSFLNSREPMTPGLISRFDSWTAWRTTRRGRGCGCRRRRRHGGSCPAWRRHRSTEVRALLAHFAPTSISRLVVQILVRSSDFVHLALQARWCRGGTCSYTPMEDSTRCALG